MMVAVNFQPVLAGSCEDECAAALAAALRACEASRTAAVNRCNDAYDAAMRDALKAFNAANQRCQSINVDSLRALDAWLAGCYESVSFENHDSCDTAYQEMKKQIDQALADCTNNAHAEKSRREAEAGEASRTCHRGAEGAYAACCVSAQSSFDACVNACGE